jgi:phosphocarrier protein HPr
MPDPFSQPQTTEAPVHECEATIVNRRGLHARAAAKFVKVCALFDAQVSVSHRNNEVSGMSIMGLMMLAAAPGCVIQLSATGPQAEPVLTALADLIDRKFDEED